MATIEPYETKQGRRYRVLYRTPERKQTTKRGFTTKRDAERFARTVEVSKDRGEFINPADASATVGELGAVWVKTQTHLKASSYRPVESAWRIHVEPRWGSVKLSDIRSSAVQQWVSEMTTGDGSGRKPKAGATVIRNYGVLAAILDEAVKDRRLLSNPARGVNLPRKAKKAHIYLSS